MERTERDYTLGEVTMAYSEIPSSGDYEFVLIHGIGMGRIVYSDIADLFSHHGRVLAVDLPGFGDSPEPGTAASLELTAEVVAAIADGRLHPVEPTERPLDAAADVLRDLLERRAVGKIVLVP